MTGETKLIFGGLIVSVLIIIGASVVLSKDNSPKRENLGTASMKIDKKEDDFGDMRTDEERTANFLITNTSDTTLRIWGIATSCNCTFATITIGDETTGEFNMPSHMNSTLKNWIGEVPPGQTATLSETYRPKIMPVLGQVSRQVRFSTNDPKNPEIEVSLKANVL